MTSFKRGDKKLRDRKNPKKRNSKIKNKNIQKEKSKREILKATSYGKRCFTTEEKSSPNLPISLVNGKRFNKFIKGKSI